MCAVPGASSRSQWACTHEASCVRAGSLWANLIFIKIPRCASSTTGGLIRNLAAQHGLNGVGQTYSKGDCSIVEPGVFANHAKLYLMEPFLAPLQRPAVYVSVVRDPISRCMSEFRLERVLICHAESNSPHDECGTEVLSQYWNARYAREGTGEVQAKLAYIREECMGRRSNTMYRYLSMPGETPAQAIAHYHLIGVVEIGVDAFAVLLAEILVRTTAAPHPCFLVHRVLLHWFRFSCRAYH